MRFSKAPLIATLMAVALSLLVILPALAENTDGQVYQGRTLSDELIVAVFDDPRLTPARPPVIQAGLVLPHPHAGLHDRRECCQPAGHVLQREAVRL